MQMLQWWWLFCWFVGGAASFVGLFGVADVKLPKVMLEF